MNNELLNISQLQSELSQISDIQDIRKAIALSDAYLTIAKKTFKDTRGIGEVKEDNERAFNIGIKAGELRLRAESRLGEVIQEMQSRGELATKGQPKKSSTVATLSDYGLNKFESSRAQKVADNQELIPVIIQKAIEKKDLPSRKALFNEIKSLKKKKKEKEKQNEIENYQKPRNIPEGFVRILEGDFVGVCLELEENLVDYIITDPPYGKEYLNLYNELGFIAKRVLKENGSLLVMTGQSYLPEIYRRLSKSLTYNWTIAYLTPGGKAVQLWDRKVNTFWKPLLWFVKGKYEGKWIGDVTKSDVNDNEKEHTEWQQSESGFLDIIQRFTNPGDLILDPFMGSGTTGIVAVKLGRKFIGIDKDREMIETATRRFAEVSL